MPRINRSTPEALGIPSSAILAFINAIEAQQIGLHSLMLVRHGQVAAEGWWQPYAPERHHTLFSLTKSFTSTAVGLAVSEGRLSLDDAVISFFPDRLPARVSRRLAAMKVRHLLGMATGHHKDTTMSLFKSPDGDWVRAFLAQPVKHAPGTLFVYNNGATYMLSAILQSLTGQTLFDYLTPRLFEPLGINPPGWESDPRGINAGAFGLALRTEDIACFGQLYLQKGWWEGRQLIPAAWVEQATSIQTQHIKKTDNDWEQGYGFQFWRSRHNAYRGDGAFGQFCLVMPDQNAVLAMTSGQNDMQAVLDQVWAHLLPAFQAEALPANPAALTELSARTAALKLPLPAGAPDSPLAAGLSGKTFKLRPNRVLKLNTARFDFAPGQVTLTLNGSKGEDMLPAGSADWLPGLSRLDPEGEQPVASAYAWTAQDTLEFKSYFVNTPSCHTLTVHFSGTEVKIEHTVNVSFGPTRFPDLHGTQVATKK